MMDKNADVYKKTPINTHAHILHNAPWQTQNGDHRSPDICKLQS